MAGGLLHSQDSIPRALGVSYMKACIVSSKSLGCWGLCHLMDDIAPAIPQKLSPEDLPKLRVPKVFRRVLLPAVWSHLALASSVHEGPGVSPA